MRVECRSHRSDNTSSTASTGRGKQNRANNESCQGEEERVKGQTTERAEAGEAQFTP